MAEAKIFMLKSVEIYDLDFAYLIKVSKSPRCKVYFLDTTRLTIKMIN